MKWGNKNQWIYIILGPSLFLLVKLLPTPIDLSPAAHNVLACTAWLVIWWLTEALPIAITSLLPLIVFPLLGILSIKGASDYYASPIIFLFLGGFILALAMEKWNLHKRIALSIIQKTGTNQRQILLGFITATGGLSMWISNTATTMMMLPIALSIVSQFNAILKSADTNQQADQKLNAYQSYIGGRGEAII